MFEQTMLVPVVLNVFVLVLMAPWDGCNLHHVQKRSASSHVCSQVMLPVT